MSKLKKRNRLNAIKDVLSRAGCTDRDTLITDVTNILGINKYDYNPKTFYKDVNELTADGEIEEIREGQSKIWKMNNSEVIHIGSKLLVNAGGGLYIPKQFQDVSIYKYSPQIHNPCKYNLLLFFPGEIFSLSFPKDELPIKICMARFKGKLSAELIEKLHQKFGQRVILLQAPYPALSSISEARFGHLLINISAQGAISLTDFNSTNGTQFSKIESQSKIDIANLYFNNTISTEEIKKTYHFDSLQSAQELIISAPGIINLGHQFFVMVFSPQE